MNTVLLTASGLAAALGLAHSLMGEVLIFRGWRRNPAALKVAGVLRRHKRILWASWHLVTLFGWAVAAVLYVASGSDAGAELLRPMVVSIALATFAGAVLVAGATRGRHPGWIVLLMIAGLTWWS